MLNLVSSRFSRCFWVRTESIKTHTVEYLEKTGVGDQLNEINLMKLLRMQC